MTAKKVTKKKAKKVSKSAQKKTATKKTTKKKALQRAKKKATKSTRPGIVKAPKIKDNDPDIKLELRREELKKDRAIFPWPLRPYQERSRDQFDAGIRRQGLFWHRRAGKDVWCLSLSRRESRKRIGAYVHFFPKHVQAKRAIWNGIDPKKGARFIDIAFADQEISRNNTDMLIEMYNGSTWQLLGSDNYDRLVGGNIVGACFSEWALCDPRAWTYIRPMIRENDGWVMFITTFRGRNHAWQMAQNLKGNEDWYIDIMGVDRSTDIDGNRILTEADIEAERKEGMSEAMIQQEYYCNPEATSDGAIYGAQVDSLRNDPTRQHADWDPTRPVYCVWNFDLPIFAAYIVLQPTERGCVILDTDILNMVTLGEALAKVGQARWPVQKHFIMSHQREMSLTMTDLHAPPEVLPSRNDYTVTTMTAGMLERMRIDGEKCDQLLDALAGYVRRERFDSQTADIAYGPDPVMSWHWRLCFPLEAFATWEYSTGDTWGRRPSYRQHDRAAKIIT